MGCAWHQCHVPGSVVQPPPGDRAEGQFSTLASALQVDIKHFGLVLKPIPVPSQTICLNTDTMGWHSTGPPAVVKGQTREHKAEAFGWNRELLVTPGLRERGFSKGWLWPGARSPSAFRAAQGSHTGECRATPAGQEPSPSLRKQHLLCFSCSGCSQQKFTPG